MEKQFSIFFYHFLERRKTMNSKTLRLLGFGASVIGLIFTELIASQFVDASEEKRLNELIDARIDAKKEEQ
jgi:hypothetical protein